GFLMWNATELKPSYLWLRTLAASHFFLPVDMPFLAWLFLVPKPTRLETLVLCFLEGVFWSEEYLTTKNAAKANSYIIKCCEIFNAASTRCFDSRWGGIGPSPYQGYLLL